MGRFIAHFPTSAAGKRRRPVHFKHLLNQTKAPYSYKARKCAGGSSAQSARNPLGQDADSTLNRSLGTSNPKTAASAPSPLHGVLCNSHVLPPSLCRVSFH